MNCKCGSFAINHHKHGRDGSDGDLCDVCYWRKRAAQGLLLRCENEMRYAGWGDYEADNPQRKDLYDEIAACLAPSNPTKETP